MVQKVKFGGCTSCFAIGLFSLMSSIGRGDDPKITVLKRDGKVLIQDGQQTVLAYNHKVLKAPKGIDQLYNRSGHLHPIKTPAGKIVTDDFSDDHAHQHGLFFAFVKAKVGNETLDFWNQHRQNANVRAGKIISISDAKFKTAQSHFRIKDSKVIFDEVWSIRAARKLDCYVIDLDVELCNRTPQDITIEKNHYGSFGLRGSGQWRQGKNSDFGFSTSSGKDRKTGNLSRERWVAMHGKIEGQYCGIAVAGHHQNFRAPQPARLHPSMPYFSFAPMAIDSFVIKSGEYYRSRFRIVTFDGKLNREKIEQLAKF